MPTENFATYDPAEARYGFRGAAAGSGPEAERYFDAHHGGLGLFLQEPVGPRSPTVGLRMPSKV